MQKMIDQVRKQAKIIRQKEMGFEDYPIYPSWCVACNREMHTEKEWIRHNLEENHD